MTIYRSICIIYKATNNINNKSYIGYTENLKRRIQYHSYYSSNSNTKFHKALRKYGIENFTWEILYESWDQEYCLNVVEDLIITEYDTFKKGYNSMPGGFRGPILTGSRNGMYGKNHTEGVKLAQSIRAKGNKSKTGQKISPETREKLKIRAQNRKLYTCIHCGIQCPGSNFTRWHGDNCRLRK